MEQKKIIKFMLINK